MAAPKPKVPVASTTTVKSGQTISAIAAKAGVSVAAVAAANPQISNLNKINVGQKVIFLLLILQQRLQLAHMLVE